MNLLKNDKTYYVALLLSALVFIVNGSIFDSDFIFKVSLLIVGIATLICLIITPRYVADAIRSRDTKTIILHTALGLVPIIVLTAVISAIT